MSAEPDVPSEDDRPGPVLAGLFLHQRAAFHTPRPGGRIDGLDGVGNTENTEDAENTADRDVTPLDHSEEDDAR